MKQVWAPWRLEYIIAPKEGRCVFCAMPKEQNDEENLILHRGEHNFIVLNKYPYLSGHLMVVPNRHIKDITKLSSDERNENGYLVSKSVGILKESFGPEGFNVGLNIGKAGGAGINEHLHTHVVPRWVGDNNFMPVIGDTRVMPQYLSDSYNALAESFKNLK